MSTQAMAVSEVYSRRTRDSYWDSWPERFLSEKFVRDLNDDSFDRSFCSTNKKSYFERSCSASEVLDEKNKFKVRVDVSHFKPEEISVKMVDDFILIIGKHEEVMDEYGWVTRQFSRRYALPEDCDSDKVSSTLSSDGILTIEAPKKCDQQLTENERMIPISVSHETPDQSK